MSDIIPMGPKGWECPKCGGVYAPWVSECSQCSGGNAGDWPNGPSGQPSPPIGSGPLHVVSIQKTVKHQEELSKAGHNVN